MSLTAAETTGPAFVAPAEPWGLPSAANGLIEAGKHPRRRRLTPGRSWMPDGGQQSADGGVVEAGELPGR